MAKQAIHVAVAVIRRSKQILISKRPKHVDQGDLWEFPGGKVEPGELVTDALQRELDEELGLIPMRSRPLIQIPHQYPQYSVLLDVWLVEDFSGEPHGREGQPIKWVPSDDLWQYQFPAANRPIITAVTLPDLCLITPEPLEQNAFLSRLESLLQQGIRLLQLRAKTLSRSEYIALAQRVLQIATDYDARVILNGHWQLLEQLPDAHGIHLGSRMLLETDSRPIPPEKLLSAACHNLAELQQATRLEVDFALLSPVQKTASHPEVEPLGWPGFRELVSEVAFPVYALGGLSVDDMETAHEMGGQGIAAIRALWGKL